jgi:hypothetical protein
MEGSWRDNGGIVLTVPFGGYEVYSMLVHMTSRAVRNDYAIAIWTRGIVQWDYFRGAIRDAQLQKSEGTDFELRQFAVHFAQHLLVHSPCSSRAEEHGRR